MKRQTNHKYVVVKEDRKCKYCNNMIPKETRCLTVNNRWERRGWVCVDCMKSLSRIAEERIRLNLAPFNDEGGAMAQQEALDSALGDFYERSEGYLNTYEEG